MLRFTPSIAVSNIGVDNNVFNETEDPKQDTTAAVGPAINLWLHLGKARLSGNATGQYLYYKTYASQRAWNSKSEALFEVPMPHLKPFIGGSYLNSRERPGFEIDARARRRDVNVKLGTDIRLSGKTTLVLSGSRDVLRYDRDETLLGSDLAKTLDHRTDTELLQLRYALTPLTTFVVSADSLQDRFVSSSARNADSLRVMPGFELKPFALISGKVSVGFRHFNVLDTGTPDFNGVVASVDARYVLRATQFSTRVNRDISYSFEPTSPYYALTDIGLEITQRVTRSWDALVRGGWQSLAYRNAAGSASSAGLPLRVDHGTVYGAGARYRLGETARIGVDANYYRRDSQNTFRTYDGLRVGASVSYGTSQ